MKKIFLSVIVLIAIVSCDKDFNTIGSDIVGDGNYDFQKYTVDNVIAYAKETGPVQTNNLPINALGIYDNPVFGVTKASFVTQMELTNEGFSIGFEPVVDSVYMYIPYFSHENGTTSEGEKLYELDSTYYKVAQDQKFKLQLFENGYVLRDFDPSQDFQTEQSYFNNQKSLIVNNLPNNTEVINNSSDLSQNDEFFINDKEIYIYKTDGNGLYVDSEGVVLTDQNDVSLRVIKERKAPGIWLDLKNEFFQTKFLDQAENGIFLNNSVFKDYFKGFYFDVQENTPGEGAMAMLDFSKAEVSVLFKSKLTNDPSVEPSRRKLNFYLGYNTTASPVKRSNTINFIEYDNSPNYSVVGDENNGDDNLFIKGGEGSVAYMDLFSGTNGEEELANLRANGWLINQANLTFFINRSFPGMDQSTLGQENQNGLREPYRIYIYDATNNKPIVDYYADGSTSSDIKRNKRGFNGLIQYDENAEGYKYTFGITEYVKRLLSDDTDLNENIRIGVAVTESINLVQNANLFETSYINIGGEELKLIPVSSVINPLGTVLYGNTNSVPQEKRLKLDIYYTQPN